MLPEEEELAKLSAQQENLEQAVSTAELELETIKADLSRFQLHYYQTVGKLFAQLDRLDADLARAQANQSPKDTALAAKAQTAARYAEASAKEAALIPFANSASVNDPRLKQIYRTAAKLMHPDLALSERERERRTHMMAQLNAAYQRGDIAVIEKLIQKFGQEPDEISGDDLGSCLIKTIRRIAQLRRRLDEIREEISILRRSDSFCLKATVDTAEESGTNPLADLAQKLRSQIAERQAQLSKMQHVSR